MEKLCSMCGIPKDIKFFTKTSNGGGIYGVGSTCKKCQSIKNRKYRDDNKTSIKIKRDEKYLNPESRKKIRDYQNKYYQENNDILLPRLLLRQKNNREKINERCRIRYQNDNVYKLKHNIRRAIQKSLKNIGSCKQNSTVNILGCSIIEFKHYIESKWENWMTWENYGKYKKGEKNYGWDLDHIIPTSSVNTEDELIKLNHFSNIQPLCSYINRYIKKNNYEF